MGFRFRERTRELMKKILILFLEIVSTNAAPPNPLQNIEVLEYHYVRSSNDRKVAWADAVKHCNSIGMSLALPRNVEENGRLLSFMFEKTKTIEPIWMGARQKDEIFVNTNGRPLTFSYFHPDQPNGKNECVALAQQPTKPLYLLHWNDAVCASKYS